MMYVISTFHYWLLLSAALGILVAWITCSRRGEGWGGITPWLVLLLVGAALIVLQFMPDRPGLWVEVATLMLATYLVGGCIGCLLGRMFGKSLGEPAKSGALAKATSRPITRVMIREKERAVDPQLKPLAAAAAAPEEPVEGLSTPRGGAGDDLTRIYGIDAETQGKLNGLGIWHYDQLANLTPGNRRWVFRKLGHEGRFPSWWWRWRYDAEKLMSGGAVSTDADVEPGAPAVPASAPVAAAAPLPAGDAAGTAAVADLPVQDRPPGLDAPRDGKADDLKRIRGIGKQNEGRLHGLGIWHFDQIALWSAEQAHWVGTYLAFAGRIEREDWVGQAKVLATGAETEFSKRADSGKVKTSRTDIDHGETNVATLGKDFDAKPPGKK